MSTTNQALLRVLSITRAAVDGCIEAVSAGAPARSEANALISNAGAALVALGEYEARRYKQKQLKAVVSERLETLQAVLTIISSPCTPEELACAYEQLQDDIDALSAAVRRSREETNDES